MSYAIELRRVADLRAYQRNTRTHPEDQLRRIVGSIHEFGWSRPVVVRGHTIAAGHGAVMAAEWIYDTGDLIYPMPGRAAGAEPFPFGTVPVIDATGWSDEQFRAYVLADNKLALLAGWDLESLQHELQALSDLGFPLDVAGFGQDDIDLILDGEAGGGSGSGGGEGDDDGERVLRVTITAETDAELLALKRALGMRSNQHKAEAHAVLGWLIDGEG